MSEIFDFLKKTEMKRAPLPPPSPELPVAAIDSIDLPENIQPVEETVEAYNEIAGSKKFDLSNSSPQFQAVLDPVTIVGEQFRVLRTRLNLLQKQSGIKKILVTSTLPKEGKSFTACGLAGVIAQEMGKRAVVIDADMRKPGSGRDLGLNSDAAGSGTAQVLQGGMEFSSGLLASINPEFWFLPSGALPPNPSELLSSPNFEQMMNAAAEAFDWVLVDSPPVLAVSDATLIAPSCDAVLLVVRASSTPGKQVLETINRIGRERICGVAINQQQVSSSRYYYQYIYQNSAGKK